MSKKVLYLPLPDQELLDQAQLMVDNFHRNSRVIKMFTDTFDRKVRFHKEGTTPLANIGASTEVYILGHGGVMDNDIENSEGKKIDMGTLAARLRTDGLGLDHKYVKLYACEGGAGGNQSTAFKLWSGMSNEGFHAVKVYGYVQSVTYATNKWGNKLGFDNILDDSGELVDQTNIQRAKNSRVSWP